MKILILLGACLSAVAAALVVSLSAAAFGLLPPDVLPGLTKALYKGKEEDEGSGEPVPTYAGGKYVLDGGAAAMSPGVVFEEGAQLALEGGAGRYSRQMFLAVTAFVAVLTGIIFWSVGMKGFSLLDQCKVWGAYAVVLAAAVTDLRVKRVPKWLPVVLLAYRLVLFIPEYLWPADSLWEIFKDDLLGLLLGFGSLLVAALLTKGGIGFGDVKLLGAVGFTCGLSMTYGTLVYALIFVAVTAVVLLVKKKATMKTALPFVPFLYLGYSCSLMFF